MTASAPWDLPSGHSGPNTGYRVLLIDDNADLLEALKAALTALGHEVMTTQHGKDALRLAYLLDPHVVVTDVIMPEFDSIKALPEFRRIRPGVKIIAISGNPHLLTLAAKHGADQVLAKPFKIAKLNLQITILMQ